MEYSDKVIVDIDDKKKSTNINLKDRLLRQLQIILKLAKINGYDISGRIRNQNGNFLSNSSILHLLSYAMTPSRVLIGEQEFIDLLLEANIEPDLLLNDNLRAKVVKKHKQIVDKPEIIIEKPVYKETLPKITSEKQKIIEPIEKKDYKRHINEPNDDRTEEEIDEQPPKLFGPYFDEPLQKRRRFDESDERVDKTENQVNKNKRKAVWDYPDDE